MHAGQAERVEAQGVRRRRFLLMGSSLTLSCEGADGDARQRCAEEFWLFEDMALFVRWSRAEPQLTNIYNRCSYQGMHRMIVNVGS